MTPDPHVLIVSTQADDATETVARCLATMGIPFTRLDTELYPFAETLAYDPSPQGGFIGLDGYPIKPTSVWYRRIRAGATPSDMDEGIATFCRQETRAALVGGLLGCDARWMSHPTAVWQSEYKPYQLRLAAKIGFAVPRTIITNNPDVVKRSFAEFGRMIVKPTRSGYVQTNEGEYSIYTSEVLERHLDEVECARFSPAIYQELIPKAFDVRVTIVGGLCVAALIDSQSEQAAMIDWRQTSNPSLPHYKAILPPELVSKLVCLTKALDLTFAAIDLVKTPSGDYVFLEVNPNGQWLWLDDMLNLGISEAVADWLARCDA